MIRTILVVAIIVLFLILSLPLLLFEFLLGKKDPVRRDAQCRRIVVWVFRVILFFSGTQVKAEGLEHVPQDQAVLFVGNHRSYFDIVTTYTLMKRTTGYVAKAEMEKIPLLASWMRQISCLFLNRRDPRAGLKTILDAIAQIKSGRSVFIFPEGTRAETAKPEELLAFHEGSMKIAEKTGCPVVPVAIYGSDHVLEQHMPFMKAAEVVIRFGAPIDLKKDLPDAYKRKAGAYLQAQIRDMLSEMAAEHPEIRY